MRRKAGPSTASPVDSHLPVRRQRPDSARIRGFEEPSRGSSPQPQTQWRWGESSANSSLGAIPCSAGKEQGILLDFGHRAVCDNRQSPIVSSTWNSIPYGLEQGVRPRDQGVPGAEQGTGTPCCPSSFRYRQCQCGHASTQHSHHSRGARTSTTPSFGADKYPEGVPVWSCQNRRRASSHQNT